MVTLLYSGNLGLGQDLGTVLRAAASLNGNGDLCILIAGTGKGLPAVKHLASDLRLHNTEFHKPVPLDRLPELLASGDIHVICQQPGTEGLLVPSKIYSTLAIGRPSLFIGPADCEVGRIISESRSGYIVGPGDIQGAANALSALIRSSVARSEMGKNAKEYYTRCFGRRRSVARIIDVIEHAAKDGWPQANRGLVHEG